MKIRRSKASSGRELAGILGVSESTIWKNIRRADWPVRRKAPWSAADVVAIRSWRAGLQEDRSVVPSGPAGKVHIALKAEQVLLTRARRTRLEKTHIAADLSARVSQALVLLLAESLASIEKRLVAAELCGLDAGAIEAALRREIRRERERLAGVTVLQLAE